MEELLFYDLDELPFVIISLAIAFTVHEFAHAVVAYWFGDDTANAQGRVTLNPLAHLDWLGTILILLAGFGWAKPVPVNRNRFKHPRLMGIAVTAAGPLSNLLLCMIGIFIFLLLQKFNFLAWDNPGISMAIFTFFQIFMTMNMTLFLFNLLPLPPLDGYRIVEDVAPRSLYEPLRKFEPYGYVVLLLIFLVPVVGRTILGPLYDFGGKLLAWIHQFFFLFL